MEVYKEYKKEDILYYLYNSDNNQTDITSDDTIIDKNFKILNFQIPQIQKVKLKRAPHVRGPKLA